jgi:hypothetical protein
MNKILIYLLLITSFAQAQTGGIGYDIAPWTVSMDSDGRNDTLSVQNIDLQYTSTAIPNRIDSAAFYLIDTELSDTEIDNLPIRIAANGSLNGFFKASGTNGFATSASAASRSTMVTNGWTIELNGELLTNIVYDNTGQAFEQNAAITTMTPTPTPIGAASYIYYQAWGLPTGLSINSYTGLITGTPTVIDEYAVTVRGTAWGDYTEDFEVALTFDVVSGAPTLENYVYIDFGFTSPAVNAYGDYFAKVDHTKYTAGATELNLIDHNNVATTIDFTNVVAWTGEASSTGSRYNGALDFLPASVTIDAFYLTSASTMEIQLDVSGEADWATKTYVVKGGGFRAFLGTQAAGNTEVSTDNYSTLYTYSCAWDAIGGGADPNSAVQTFTLDAVPNGSGIISIKYRKASGATESECSWLLLETYN